MTYQVEDTPEESPRHEIVHMTGHISTTLLQHASGEKGLGKLSLAVGDSQLDALDDEVRAGQEGRVGSVGVEGGVAGGELGGHGLLGGEGDGLVLLGVEVHDLDALVPGLVGGVIGEDTLGLPAELSNGLGLEDGVDVGVEDGFGRVGVDLVTLFARVS